MLAVELHLLQISSLRPAAPLPWPTAQALALAKELGFVDPVTVRPIPQTTPQRYEIVTGLKHWLLAQRAQLATVPVHIHEQLNDQEARRLIEQELGQELGNPLAEAQALQALVAQGKSIAAAGRELGRSRTDASHLLRLLQLSPRVQARIARGELAPGKARALVGLAEGAQWELAVRIGQEKLNTRQVEALAKTYKSAVNTHSVSGSLSSLPPGKDPNIVRLETELGRLIGTPVTIHSDGQGRGQLVIDFDNLDILDGVLEKMGYIP